MVDKKILDSDVSVNSEENSRIFMILGIYTMMR